MLFERYLEFDILKMASGIVAHKLLLAPTSGILPAGMSDGFVTG